MTNSQREPFVELFNSIDFNKIIDHPNILIAAAFWDNDRYQAARTCYKYMRAIDDLIDCYKSTHKVIAENEKNRSSKMSTDGLPWPAMRIIQVILAMCYSTLSAHTIYPYGPLKPLPNR